MYHKFFCPKVSSEKYFISNDISIVLRDGVYKVIAMKSIKKDTVGLFQRKIHFVSVQHVLFIVLLSMINLYY